MIVEKTAEQYSSAELLALLRKCPLFSPMSDFEIAHALTLFDARSAAYARGEILHRMGEPLPAFAVVLSGTVQVYSDDLDGNRMLMANVEPSGMFGESLAYLHIPAPVYIQTGSGAEVLWLDPACLHLSDPAARALHARFTAALAVRALSMNERIQILSKPTLREKILCFLSEAERKNGAPTFTVPFDREGLATYLGANRTALSRELSKMKEEGIIDYYKNSFKIL